MSFINKKFGIPLLPFSSRWKQNLANLIALSTLYVSLCLLGIKRSHRSLMRLNIGEPDASMWLAKHILLGANKYQMSHHLRLCPLTLGNYTLIREVGEIKTENRLSCYANHMNKSNTIGTAFCEQFEIMLRNTSPSAYVLAWSMIGMCLHTLNHTSPTYLLNPL